MEGCCVVVSVVWCYGGVLCDGGCCVMEGVVWWRGVV